MKIQIPVACDVPKEQLALHSNGFYCKTCTTVVHDLTGFSPTQLAFFTANQSGEICGQLTQKQQHFSFRGPNLLQSLVAGTLLFSASTFAHDTGMLHEETPFSLTRVLTQFSQDDSTVMRLVGIVRDKDTKEVIPVAKVVLVLNKTEYRVLTDWDGKFVFPSLSINALKKAVIRVEFPEIKEGVQIFQLSAMNLSKELILEVLVEEELMIIGQVLSK